MPTEANVGLKFEQVFPSHDRRITIELQYRGLDDVAYDTGVIIDLKGGMPGYPDPIIEDVHVHPATSPKSDERAWLLEDQ